MIVASAQYNYAYGNQIHYPYSIATIAAAVAEQFPEIEWLPTCVRRGKIEADAERCAKADVLLVSCYVWNWEETKELIARWREAHPFGIVILGGPQVPDDPDAALVALGEMQADIAVHGEGEQAAVELFTEMQKLSFGALTRPLAGTSTQHGYGGPRMRMSDLAVLPSPYLSGMIDRLAEPLPEGMRYVAAWETTRGCPYKCAMCDWGSATYTKVRRFPDERLHWEIEWFGQHDIEYIDCCDANFGMFRERDETLAVRLAAARLIHGAPRAFRSSWAKNSSERVIEVAKPLKEVGMLTAVGLALESLDTTALDTIERKNLPMATYGVLTKQFAEAGIPTYTELILGLPGETLESWTRGLGVLLEESAIGQVYVYQCSVLPNAPMADPAYRAQHGIETIRTPIWLAHSKAGEQGQQEWEDIVIQTATMPAMDMRMARLLAAWVVIGEQLGILAPLRQAWQRMTAQSAIDFYAGLTGGWLRAGMAGDLDRLDHLLRRYIARGYLGGGWGVHQSLFGEIEWPLEEWAWLVLCEVPGRLGRAVDGLGLAIGLEPDESEAVACATVNSLRLAQPEEDKAIWARDMMWFGRRRGAFRR